MKIILVQIIKILLLATVMGYCRKNPNRWGRGGVEDILFSTPPGILHFFTLPLEIPNKTKLNPWIFHKIVLDSLAIPTPKTKTPGNSTLFFLGHPWKFHFVFNSKRRRSQICLVSVTQPIQFLLQS